MFPVYKHWLLGPLADGANVVIPYANRDPALVDRPIARGRAVVLTTPVSDAASQRDPWNMLPTGEEPWPFVMLANEMLHYLAGSSRMNYLAGETALVRMPADQHHTIFSLLPPVGDPIRQAVDERENVILVTGTDEVGHYRLTRRRRGRGNTPGLQRQPARRRQPAPGADADEIKAVFGDTPYRVARSREEIVRDVNFGRVGRELYPTLIVLLVIVLAAEQLLANWFYRPGSQRSVSAAAEFTREREGVRQAESAASSVQSGAAAATEFEAPLSTGEAAVPAGGRAVLP